MVKEIYLKVSLTRNLRALGGPFARKDSFSCISEVVADEWLAEPKNRRDAKVRTIACSLLTIQPKPTILTPNLP